MQLSQSMFVEPTMTCPNCGQVAYADWVDIGFGPYSAQVSPYHCLNCGWVEGGCMATRCHGDHCHSWIECGGAAMGFHPGESVTYHGPNGEEQNVIVVTQAGDTVQVVDGDVEMTVSVTAIERTDLFPGLED